MVGFCTSFASAELPLRSAMQRFNAWVASALVAGQITVGSTLAPIQSVLDSLNYGAGMPWTPSYTYQGATWDDDILNRSTIKIRPNSYTIDGVTYSDVIISSDATQKFRVNAYDLETAWNIASQSSGSYGTGIGTFNGVPIYRVNNQAVSQMYLLSDGSNGIGNFVVNTSTSFHDDRAFSTVSIDGNTPIERSINESDWEGLAAQVENPTSSTGGNLVAGFKWRQYISPSINNSNRYYFESAPFDFDWVSGTVPAEQLPEGSMLHFRIPSEHNDSTHTDTNYSIPDFVQNYPTYSTPDGYTFEFDPSLNPDFDLDIDASDALGNIISAIIAAYLAGLIDTPSTVIEYTIDEPEPVPQPGVIDPLPDPDPAPDDPVPGTTIADTDWIKLDEILRWIQSTIDSIRHLTESLQTMLDSIFDAIQSAIQHIAEIPEAIRELADKILEDIELGPSKLFDKALDILKSLFMPLLLPIKAMMNLWHYVVEWIQSISSPFTWIFGVMSGTSYNMVLPIYAVLAGSICIAIYKALGR